VRAGCGLSHRTTADALLILRNASARIEVTVPSRSYVKRAGITIHRSPTLRPEDITEVNGIRCTTAARTLLDLADVVNARRLADAIEGAERQRLLDQRQLERVLEHGQGRPAAARLRAALAAYTGARPPATPQGARAARVQPVRRGGPSQAGRERPR
jgi:hypothetical protein